MTDIKIAFIGDCYHTDDLADVYGPAQALKSTGGYGKLFNTMLKASGIERSSCLVTNVFNIRPLKNDLDNLFVSQKEGLPFWPKVKGGKYVPKALAGELKRLYAELTEFKPDVIIALGGVPLWALTGQSSLAKRHGFLHHWRKIPVFPTWHPTTILRKYESFYPAVQDIRKAVAYATGEQPEETFKFIEKASLQDIRDFIANIKPDDILSIDIETKPKYRSITRIGLGTSRFSLSVQFHDQSKSGQSYWKTAEEEATALGLIQEVLLTPNTKIGQNFLYDIVWMKTIFGLDVKGPVIDTRLMHFGLFPELPHSLAELASTWLVMPPWKALHAGFENDVGSGED